MRRFLLLWNIVLLPLAISAQQQDDLCLWQAVSMKKSLGKDWSVGLRTEHRAYDMVRTTNQYYIRPSVGYNILSWMNITLQADFAWSSSGFNIRCLPQVTFSHKAGGFDFSLRQRLQTTWKSSDDSCSHLFRTKAQVRYKIKGTPLTPLLAVEPYYMSELVRCRFYAGVGISITDNLYLLLQYVRQEQYTRTYDDNVMWLTFNVKL